MRLSSFLRQAAGLRSCVFMAAKSGTPSFGRKDRVDRALAGKDYDCPPYTLSPLALFDGATRAQNHLVSIARTIIDIVAMNSVPTNTLAMN